MKEYRWALKIFIKEQPFYIILILFLYILMYLIQPLELVLIQSIIKLLTDTSNSHYIMVIIIMYLIVNSIKNIQFSFSLLFIEILEYKVTAVLQKQLFKSIASTDLINFDKSEYLLKIDRAKNTLWYQLTNIVNDIFHVIGVIISLMVSAVIIYRIGSLYLVLFVIMGILQNVFTKKNASENTVLLRMQDAKNRKIKYFNNLIMDRTKIKEIKSYKIFSWIEEKRMKQFSEIESEHLSFSKRWVKINSFWAIFMLLFENSILLLICYQVVIFVISLDQMILLTQSQGQVVNAIDNIATFFSDMKKNQVYISEFKSLINNKDKKKAKVDIQKATNDTDYILSFNNVSFFYNDKKQALKNINFTLRRGEIIALVGENGCGKSTLSKIAAGLLQPSQGFVLNFHTNISATFQDYSKFEFPIHENVSIGEVKYINDYERIKHAMQMGQCYYLIDHLPLGLNTVLGKRFDKEGTDISEGQWQKVAISRSLIKDFDLIIFDEPSAALDPISEKKQFFKIKENLEGKTVFLISHRIGIVKLAHRIFYMEKGQIVESGTHENLMNKNGKYKNFYLSQAKWYENEGETHESK